MTGTVDGDVVIWDQQALGIEGGTRSRIRHAVKVMRLQRSAITYLGLHGDYLVSGGKNQVQFFDSLMRLVAWFDNTGEGTVTSVAFSLNTPIRNPAAENIDENNR